MDLTEYLKTKSALIECRLATLIPQKQAPHFRLFDAARYSLLGGGKRIRPILALAVMETLGGDQEKALNAACALEMIHTYSLIHDDLPCMDDDDYRRGKPSLHKAFPEGHAVLTGDFLLTHAFEVLANDIHLTDAQKVKLIAILAKHSGGEGMIGGQIMDLEAENHQIDLDTLRLIHNKKTGAMITASLEFGGVLSQASSADMAVLGQFGEEIGLAFQVIDDVLDVTESKQKHGKVIASDLANNKSTYVSLLGLKESQEFAQTILESAEQKLKRLSVNSSLLVNLAKMIVSRKS